MFEMLKLRKLQGYQAIPNPLTIRPPAAFRGWPELSANPCPADCDGCGVCPTKALQGSPQGPTLDLGACVFCGDCVETCPQQSIRFTNGQQLSASKRETLVIKALDSYEDYQKNSVTIRKEIQKIFGRSLKLRQISAAGCNGCEWELNACGNVNFDIGRYGIDFVASPRHADGVVITGPISENMAFATEDTFLHIPEPRVVILAGTCAISGGVFADSPALNRAFLDKYPVDLYIPGCPVHPLTVVHGITRFLGITRT